MLARKSACIKVKNIELVMPKAKKKKNKRIYSVGGFFKL